MLLRRRMMGGGDAHFENKYLTFEALEECTFSLTIPAAVNTSKITSVSYSLDNGETWITTNNSASDVIITTPTVIAGKKVLWKGIGSSFANSTSVYSNFSSTGRFFIYGNIMSLIKGDDFLTNTSFTSNSTYVFSSLFRNNTNITSVENLILNYEHAGFRETYSNMFAGCSGITKACKIYLRTSDTALYGTYSGMFYNCTSLTYVPDIFIECLNITNINVNVCLSSTFYGCTSLVTAPSITTNVGSYQFMSGMFGYCSSLKNVPSLSRTILGQSSHSQMFAYCTSLEVTPELPSGALATDCFNGMFSRCSSLATPPELPYMTLASGCYANMFSYCTSLEIAPTLPALELVSSCYSFLFRNCSKLKYVKMLATIFPESSWNTYWMLSVPSGGTFVKNANATLPSGAVPSTWTIINDNEE